MSSKCFNKTKKGPGTNLEKNTFIKNKKFGNLHLHIWAISSQSHKIYRILYYLINESKRFSLEKNPSEFKMEESSKIGIFMKQQY